MYLMVTNSESEFPIKKIVWFGTWKWDASLDSPICLDTVEMALKVNTGMIDSKLTIHYIQVDSIFQFKRSPN